MLSLPSLASDLMPVNHKNVTGSRSVSAAEQEFGPKRTAACHWTLVHSAVSDSRAATAAEGLLLATQRTALPTANVCHGSQQK